MDNNGVRVDNNGVRVPNNNHKIILEEWHPIFTRQVAGIAMISASEGIGKRKRRLHDRKTESIKATEHNKIWDHFEILAS